MSEKSQRVNLHITETRINELKKKYGKTKSSEAVSAGLEELMGWAPTDSQKGASNRKVPVSLHSELLARHRQLVKEGKPLWVTLQAWLFGKKIIISQGGIKRLVDRLNKKNSESEFGKVKS